jgi:hypothetical protein
VAAAEAVITLAVAASMISKVLEEISETSEVAEEDSNSPLEMPMIFSNRLLEEKILLLASLTMMMISLAIVDLDNSVECQEAVNNKRNQVISKVINHKASEEWAWEEE